MRVGFIGCGFVTMDLHLPALRHVPEVEVDAVADIDHAALQRVKIGRRYESAEALLTDPDVEVVAVCVPPTAHADVACAALDAGKHVLVEKPLAASLADADRIIECAGRSPGKAVMGFNFRRHRFVAQARELVAAGALGRVSAIRTALTGAVLQRGPEWRIRRDAGGGGMLDRAVHHFDLWRHLLGDEVEEVQAATGSDRGDDQTAAVTARMAGGAIATALALDDTTIGHDIAIYGTEASVHLDLARFEGFHLVPAGELPGSPRARARRLVENIAPARVRESLRAIRRGGDHLLTYEDQWRRFAEIVREDRSPEPSLADGRAALEIALAAIESAEAGAPVRLGVPGQAVFTDSVIEPT